MNPNITAGGSSFKGAYRYYMHDRGSDTRERIAWTRTVNMLTADPDRAWKVMAFTAKAQARLKEASGQSVAGRKMQKPVLAYSLSWHPEQDPDRDHMTETAMQSLKVLGLEDHEAIIIAHRDTPHRHVHVIVNRVHPLTGLVASNTNARLKLSDFALEYGNRHGLTYNSPQRAENKRKREEGKAGAYRDPGIAGAWAESDSGRSFLAALKQRGFLLAQGEKRLVVVDKYGKIHNPLRHIEGIKTKEFRERLRDLDLSALPDADTLAQQRADEHEQSKQTKTRRRHDTPEQTAPAQVPEAVPFEQSGAPEPVSAPHEAPPSLNSGDEAQSAVPGLFSEPVVAGQYPLPPPAINTERGLTPPRDTSELERPAAAVHSDDAADVGPDPVAERLNAMQDRHWRERDELTAMHDRRIEAERHSLAAYYRLDGQRKAIADLERRCEKPTWWRRLLGIARRDRAELDRCKLTYRDAQTRYDERISTLQQRRSEVLDRLHLRHERERELVKKLAVCTPIQLLDSSQQSHGVFTALWER